MSTIEASGNIESVDVALTINRRVPDGTPGSYRRIIVVDANTPGATIAADGAYQLEISCIDEPGPTMTTKRCRDCRQLVSSDEPHDCPKANALKRASNHIQRLLRRLV